MSQQFSSSFVQTNIPGAYNEVVVKSNPTGLGSSGIIVIMGEADGGDSYTNVALKDNSFTPDQLDKVTQQYISGPIVDAMRALSSPSNDTDIVGSANRIFISKTNLSTKASKALDTDYGTLYDRNFGIRGNKDKQQVTSIAAESAPTVSGVTISAFGAPLNGQTFSVRLNGSAVTVVTLSGTAGDHSSNALLIIELNAQLPAGLVASAGSASNSLKLTVTADAAAYRKGWGKSFELIDSTPGDLAAVGLVAGLTSSSVEPGVEIAISNSQTGASETLDIQSIVAFEMGYMGTTGTLTINQTSKTMTTTVVGGSGTSLSIDLTTFATIGDLTTFIASQTGYSAFANVAAQQKSPLTLDEVAAIGIASTSTLRPGRVKNAAYLFNTVVNTSRTVTFTPTSLKGLPAPAASPSFLAGGTKGPTLAADIVAATAQMAGVQANIIVPLFSRDASLDITDGLTDSASTYTIDAVHASVKNHCLQYSTPKLKRNRICILSFWGTYAQSKAKAQGLASYRAVMTFQKCTQLNSAGTITSFMPWFGACIAAGMQTGGFYKAIVCKLGNVISFTDPSGYDSGSPGDVEDALAAGLLMLTKETAGNKWVSDATTYGGLESTFVYASLQAVYLSDILALDLTASFQSAFVGKSLADVSAATALSYLAQKMSGYKGLKMISASDDAPLGFKNAKVSISGPTMSISVEIKLTTAVYFIPISINISQIEQSAG